jgi:FixJ family two-component response regulator
LNPDNSNPVPSPSSTVFVVDDDASFLTAVSRLLRAGGYTVQTFTTVADLLKRLTPGTAGCVLTDLRMPGQSGLNLQALLVAQNNPLPVIFLSGHGDIPTSVRAMRHGAVDFLSKPVKKQILFEAIERAFSLEAEQRRRRTHARALHARFDTLSAREREVLVHIISGKLNKQIAFDVGITERTIKAHRASIMDKLNVQSVAELVRFAQELGIEPAP